MVQTLFVGSKIKCFDVTNDDKWLALSFDDKTTFYEKGANGLFGIHHSIEYPSFPNTNSMVISNDHKTLIIGKSSGTIVVYSFNGNYFQKTNTFTTIPFQINKISFGNQINSFVVGTKFSGNCYIFKYNKTLNSYVIN